MLSQCGLRATSISRCLPPPTYTYHILDPPLQFRLVKLLPSERTSDEITCSIVDRSFISAESYEALSYVWGNEQHGHRSINIISPWGTVTERSKFRLRLRSNLYSALKRLRHADKERTLWIDAICINQEDNHERSQQVAIMRQIFSRAAIVLIWLGEEGDDGISLKQIDETLLSVYELVDNLEDAAKMEPPPSPELVTRIPISALTMGRTSEEVSRIWISLARLFQRPWFTRAWIFQEIVMANYAVMLWGRGLIDWKFVASIATAVKFSSFYDLLPADPILRGVDTVYQIKTTREQVTNHKYLDHLYYLSLTRSRIATDPLDKYVSILGVVDPFFNEACPTKINYDIGSSQMYETIAGAYLTLRDNKTEQGHWFGPFIILSCALIHSDAEAILYPNWPSWVPDWRQTDVPQPLQYLGMNRTFNACGTTIAHYFLDKKILHVKGIILFTISSLCAPYVPATLSAPDIVGAHFHQTKSWLDSCIAVYTNHHTDTLQPSGSLWRAMTCNMTLAGTPLELKHHDGYVAFRSFYGELDCVRTLDDYERIQFSTLEDNVGRFEGTCKYWTKGRAFFGAMEGHVGWAPPRAKVGDVVVLLLGGRVPFVLRETGDGRWRLVGECWVLGFMDGEGVEGRDVRELIII